MLCSVISKETVFDVFKCKSEILQVSLMLTFKPATGKSSGDINSTKRICKVKSNLLKVRFNIGTVGIYCKMQLVTPTINSRISSGYIDGRGEIQARLPATHCSVDSYEIARRPSPTLQCSQLPVVSIDRVLC